LAHAEIRGPFERIAAFAIGGIHLPVLAVVLFEPAALSTLDESIIEMCSPSSGSALMNRTAAGVCSSSGIRSSARCWSSTLTPSHTFGSGQA
jgi:hypothetical protein